MTNEKRQDLEGMVGILKQLDCASLTIIKAGAELLKARQDLNPDSGRLDKQVG